MHSTDYYERPRPQPHRHVWIKSGDTAHCICGARSGRMSLGEYIDMFYPPGVPREVVNGAPWTPEIPRLPKNWKR